MVDIRNSVNSLSYRELQVHVIIVMLFLSRLASACVIVNHAETFKASTELPTLDRPWEEQGGIWLVFDPEQSPVEILTEAFDIWLAQYTLDAAPVHLALTDYEIDALEAVSDPFFAGDYEFVFYVEYSVRPKADHSRWLAGDGRLGSGGWIVGKNHYVGVRIIGEEVWILVLGPCPMC